MKPTRVRPQPNSLAAQILDWLTVVDAAAYLARALGEEVHESHVLQLGLDGVLQVSVRFPSRAWARTGVLPAGELEVDDLGNLKLQWHEEEPAVIDGVWDLMTHAGAGEIELERQFQRAIEGPPVSIESFGGIYVCRPDRSEWAQLVSLSVDDVKVFPDIVASGLPLVKVEKSYPPLHELPGDSMLVIRTAAIDAFLAALTAEASGPPVAPGQTTTPSPRAAILLPATEAAEQPAAAARWAHLPAFKSKAIELATSRQFSSRAEAAKHAADYLEDKPGGKAERYDWTTVDTWLKAAGWSAKMSWDDWVVFIDKGESPQDQPGEQHHGEQA